AELHGLANALTDVTGFGLIGHALEMARGAGLTVEIEAAAVPTIAGVEALLRAGVRTGASDRNWASCAEAIDVIGQLETWRRDLLTDPQTSGGLLIAASDDNIERVMDRARRTGFTEARVVGRLRSGPPRVCVKED
ncbi:MAG TPA: AIR synthase-related protein, partial [Caulobacteraceae bacterium]